MIATQSEHAQIQAKFKELERLLKPLLISSGTSAIDAFHTIEDLTTAELINIHKLIEEELRRTVGHW